MASIVQEYIGLPSISTVQAPQVPRSQTCLAPVRSRWLRSASSSVTRGSTVTACARAVDLERQRHGVRAEHHGRRGAGARATSVVAAAETPADFRKLRREKEGCSSLPRGAGALRAMTPPSSVDAPAILLSGRNARQGFRGVFHLVSKRDVCGSRGVSFRRLNLRSARDVNNCHAQDPTLDSRRHNGRHARGAAGRDARRPHARRLPRARVARLGRHGRSLPRRGHAAGRRVALKVLPPELAADPRALRSASSARRRRSPRSTIPASSRSTRSRRPTALLPDDGAAWTARTLGEAIPRGGCCRRERLLRIGIEVADAMAAAQQRGITHRDLKPANMMLTAERPREGARLRAREGARAPTLRRRPTTDAATQRLTGEGRIVGTVAYMSPEQAEGGRSTRAPTSSRSASCCTRWRPASGPFTRRHQRLGAVVDPQGHAALGERAARRHPAAARAHDPARAREARRGPLPVRDRPAARPRGPEARRRHGRPGARARPPAASGWWPEPAAGAAGRCRSRWAPRSLVLAAMAAVFLQGRAPATAADGRRSLAVLYFDNMTGDPSLDWLRTGLTDMLVTEPVAVLRPARAAARSGSTRSSTRPATATTARSRARSVSTVARQAQATTALVGSFVRAGERIRIHASLQDPRAAR